jgi:hypothetical protein
MKKKLRNSKSNNKQRNKQKSLIQLLHTIIDGILRVSSLRGVENSQDVLFDSSSDGSPTARALHLPLLSRKIKKIETLIRLSEKQIYVKKG